jgi:hypothetical protein
MVSRTLVHLATQFHLIVSLTRNTARRFDTASLPELGPRCEATRKAVYLEREEGTSRGSTMATASAAGGPAATGDGAVKKVHLGMELDEDGVPFLSPMDPRNNPCKKVGACNAHHPYPLAAASRFYDIGFHA